MNLRTEKYLNQMKRWPPSGRHILAQFDAETVVLYQAYRPSIARFAVQNQGFGGEFSFSRMSWIKPNFLWMMYRSGWGTKEGQEVTLAVRLLRSGFDEILRRAVHSSFVPELYDSRENWRERLDESPVRLQWDPDHNPRGEKEDRRAIQLGLASDVLRQYAQDWIVSIEDISEFVAEQRISVAATGFENLVTPQEAIYPVADRCVADHLELISE